MKKIPNVENRPAVLKFIAATLKESSNARFSLALSEEGCNNKNTDL